MTRPRIGLALGSGAARGWSHIGVIEALTEAGIEPDIVCGTSMGSFVGAAYVAKGLTELRQWAEAANWQQIVGLIDVRLSGGGLIDGKEIVKFMRQLGIAGPIEGFSKPFAAVATALINGREIWLQSGPIDEAVRASIALPGVLCPVTIAGRWMVDGGLANPVPVSVCRALGADVIIAVNLNGDLLGRRFETPTEPPPIGQPAQVPSDIRLILGELPAAVREPAAQIVARLLRPAPAVPGYFDVLANSINIMQDHITRTRLAGEPPHVMLVPRLRHIGVMEFNRAKEAIAEGRTCVKDALPILRHHL